MKACVSFACNDERGNFRGKCEALHFQTADGYEADLAGIFVRLSFRPDDCEVGFGRKPFDYLPGTLRGFYGNLCWDKVDMPLQEAVRLMRYALSRGFVYEGGTIEGPFAEVDGGAR